MITTSDKMEAKAALLKALAGCGSCEFDEAEGALMDHCDKCCRKVTTAAWAWAYASSKLRAIQKPNERLGARRGHAIARAE